MYYKIHHKPVLTVQALRFFPDMQAQAEIVADAGYWGNSVRRREGFGSGTSFSDALEWSWVLGRMGACET